MFRVGFEKRTINNHQTGGSVNFSTHHWHLFVCQSNVFRSRVAEIIFNRKVERYIKNHNIHFLDGEWPNISSAGIVVPQHANIIRYDFWGPAYEELFLQHGVQISDLENYSAVMLQEWMIELFPHIWAMSSDVLVELIHRFPKHKHKMGLFPKISPTKPFSIDDPGLKMSIDQAGHILTSITSVIEQRSFLNSYFKELEMTRAERLFREYYGSEFAIITNNESGCWEIFFVSDIDEALLTEKELTFNKKHPRNRFFFVVSLADAKGLEGNHCTQDPFWFYDQNKHTHGAKIPEFMMN